MTHNVKLISTATVVNGDEVLFVRYSEMPDHQRGWFMPHDLLRELEHPQDAARRALREQLGIEPPALPLKHIESFRGRDKTWHLSFHFLATLPAKVQPRASSAIAAAQWFGRGQLPPRAEVSHHGWALDVLEKVTARNPG
jgi:ADP-ribose pyrophosphatase YjhB (NUDIX family)